MIFILSWALFTEQNVHAFQGAGEIKSEVGKASKVDASVPRIQSNSKTRPDHSKKVCLKNVTMLQIAAEKALADKNGAIVALDPNTGAILAMASNRLISLRQVISGMDCSTRKGASASKAFPILNKVLSGQYPPASVFKIIVALAGLEEGVISPEERITCNGHFFLGRHRYNCLEKQGHGDMNLHSALVESCDVYFYHMGQKLGVDKIAQYANNTT